MESPERASRLPRLRGALTCVVRFLTRLDVVLAVAITLVAGVLRFVRLGEPEDIIPLDETYYTVNSFGYLKYGVDMACSGGAAPEHFLVAGIPCPAEHTLDPAFAVHPPVGKWLIAAGIKVFGYSSFGYRAGAALFGTLSVLVLYMLARRLWKSPWIAATAATLLALDGLHFVQSRIAMLDIFLAFFVLLAVWLLVEDRERTPPGYRGLRGWRIAAGAAVGLALATKWSAAFVIPMMFVVALVWELDRISRRRPAFIPPVAGELAPDAGMHDEARRPEEDGAYVPATETAEPEYESLLFQTDERPYEEPQFHTEDPVSRATLWMKARGVPRTVVSKDFWVTAGRSARRIVTKDFWLDVAKATGTAVVSGAKAVRAALAAAAKATWAVRRQIMWAAGSFVLVPLVVYVLTYGSWFAATPDGEGGKRYTAPRCDDPNFNGYASPVNSKIWNLEVWPSSWRSWVCYQREIFDYHKNLKNFDDKGKPIHPYLTRAWSWPWIGRPTAHEFDSRPSEIKENPDQAEILGLPNPVMWFTGFFIALPLCAWWAIKRRDQTAALLLLLFAPLYVPWLVTSRPLFMFYMTPAVAFLILLLCHVAHRALEEWSLDKQRLLAALMLVTPFTPLFIQWFSVPGFTMPIGTNVTPGPLDPLTLVAKVLAVAATGVVVWAAVAALYQGVRPRRLLVAYAGFTLVLFAYFYPVLAAVHIPDTGLRKPGISHTVWQAYGWRSHMWLTADCRSEGIKIACWI